MNTCHSWAQKRIRLTLPPLPTTAQPTPAMRSTASHSMFPITALLTALLIGCASQPQTPTPNSASPQLTHPPTEESSALLQADTFDQVWTIIRDTHPDPSINQGSWNEARLTFRERAIAATTQESFRATLQDMMQTLGDSHFAIIPNAVAGSASAVGGWSGMTVQVLDGVPIVTRVRTGSPAAAAGIRPGWRVLRSEGDSVDDLLAEIPQPRTALERSMRDRAVNGFLGGRPGMSPEMDFVDTAGVSHTVRFTFDAPPGELVTLGNLPPMPALCSARVLEPTEVAALGVDPAQVGRVGLLTFTIWMPALTPQIDAALFGFRDVDALVIDLRGNPGGIALMVSGVAGHLLDEPTSLGQMQGRSMRMDFKANPRLVDGSGTRVGTIRAPVAILIDGLSGSTSEMFAGGLVDIGRAEVFGHCTAGAALPATTHPLKNGDILLHAIADFRTPSGISIEGSGICQRIGPAPTASDYAAQPEAELRDALRWIAAERAQAKPSDSTSSVQETPK